MFILILRHFHCFFSFHFSSLSSNFCLHFFPPAHLDEQKVGSRNTHCVLSAYLWSSTRTKLHDILLCLLNCFIQQRGHSPQEDRAYGRLSYPRYQSPYMSVHLFCLYIYLNPYQKRYKDAVLKCDHAKQLLKCAHILDSCQYFFIFRKSQISNIKIK